MLGVVDVVDSFLDHGGRPTLLLRVGHCPNDGDGKRVSEPNSSAVGMELARRLYQTGNVCHNFYVSVLLTMV